MTHAELHGIAYSTPSRSVSNHELSTFVDTSHEWIVERTGICSRYISDKEETTFDLAMRSVEKTLAESGIKPSDLSGVIIGTSSSDYVFPSLACEIARVLGVVGFAFDVQAACSGFAYAIDIGRRYIESGAAKHLLIIGIDTPSRILDWNERKTCVLFGDGAGSCVLSAHTKGIISSFIEYIPDHGKILYAHNAMLFPDKHPATIVMDGQKVYKQAVTSLSEGIMRLIAEAGCTPESIDCVVPHQANLRILEAVMARVPIAAEKFFSCVDRYGNTSAASIPIALAEAIEIGKIRPGMRVLFIAFGGGMTCGGAIFEYAGNRIL